MNPPAQHSDPPAAIALLRHPVWGRLIFYVVALTAMMFLLRGWVRNNTYPAPPVTVPATPPTGILDPGLINGASRKVSAWYQEAPGESAETPMLVYFHGNGENLQTMWESGSFARFRSMGMPFLAVDYPGYGRSEGAPDEAGLIESGILAVEWLQQKHPQKPLIIAGWSLGSAVAVQTAAHVKPQPDALILMSPWSSLDAVARVHFPDWMVNLLLRESYDSLKIAADLNVPALVIHGAGDPIIPPNQGATVAEALPQATLIRIPGRGHNDLQADERVWQAWRQFIADRFPTTETPPRPGPDNETRR